MLTFHIYFLIGLITSAALNPLSAMIQDSESPVNSQASSPTGFLDTKSPRLDTDSPDLTSPRFSCSATPTSPYTVTLEDFAAPTPMKRKSQVFKYKRNELEETKIVYVKDAQPDILTPSFDEKECAVLAQFFCDTVINRQELGVRIQLFDTFAKLQKYAAWAYSAIPENPWDGKTPMTHLQHAETKKFECELNSFLRSFDCPFTVTPEIKKIFDSIINNVWSLALSVKLGCWNEAFITHDPAYWFTWTLEHVSPDDFNRALNIYRTTADKQCVFKATPCYTYAYFIELHGFLTALVALEPFKKISEDRYADYMAKFRARNPDWKPTT